MHTLWIIFLVNWALNILAIEFLALRKIKTIINIDEARDSKYPAFRRLDTWWFNRPWLFLTCHLGLFKIVFGISCCFICGLFFKLLTFGTKDEQQFRGIRYHVARAAVWFTSRVVMIASASVMWIFVERPKFCYKKYLGPDWQPDYESRRVSTIVTNHSSFIDSTIHCTFQLPCIIAKDEVKNVPGIGNICAYSGAVFVKRTDKANKQVV